MDAGAMKRIENEKLKIENEVPSSIFNFQFSISVQPLAPRERMTVWALGALVAISRWPAVSKTLWDWDEALFALALRDFDVTAHHPHPPGFPLFIALAKALSKLIPLDPFHALQTVTVVASLFVFPAMFFLARELRARTFVAIASGLLLAFFPNVWFFGGTAFSDVPSMVLALVACTLLLRGCRSDASLLAGAVVLGIAAGFRPQNLIIGFAPMLIAFFHRRRTAILGAFLTAAILAVSYGAAAHFSGGWDVYRETLTRHERYIREVDSFLSPIRPWLPQVADDFFVRPYRAPLINVVVTLLVLLGIRKKRAWLAAAIFGPFLLFAWLYLDFHSASRFSIGYMPLYALVAAEGIPRKGQTFTIAAMLTLMIAWMVPVLRVVHTTDSPPVAAIQALGPNVVVDVDPRLAAHAQLYGVVQGSGARVRLREGASIAPGAKNFVRERDRLEGVARARYFEVSIVP